MRRAHLGFHWRSKRRRSIYPLDERSPYVGQKDGGAAGWRGSNWETVRAKALVKAKGYSQVSGWPESATGGRFSVDHIIPFRISRKLGNTPLNLRVVDVINWAAIDNAFTLKEKPAVRGLPITRF